VRDRSGTGINFGRAQRWKDPSTRHPHRWCIPFLCSGGLGKKWKECHEHGNRARFLGNISRTAMYLVVPVKVPTCKPMSLPETPKLQSLTTPCHERRGLDISVDDLLGMQIQWRKYRVHILLLRKDKRIRKWSYKQCNMSLPKHRPEQGPAGEVSSSMCMTD